MKFLILCLIFFFLILLCGSWFIARRPMLLAVGALDENLKFWSRLTSSEEAQVIEAYKQIKHLLPETLKRRIQVRNWKASGAKSAKVYVIKDKQWLYFYADHYPFKAPKVDALRGSMINSVHYHLSSKRWELKVQ